MEKMDKIPQKKEPLHWNTLNSSSRKYEGHNMFFLWGMGPQPNFVMWPRQPKIYKCMFTMHEEVHYALTRKCLTEADLEKWIPAEVNFPISSQ